MVRPLYYSLLLPVTLLAALCTDTRNDIKFVCTGDPVEVFQNITSTSFKEEITLYKTFAGKQEPIAVWVMQNFSIKEITHDTYKHKVSLENGTILLQDFQASDEGAYVMLYKVSSKRKELELCALYPPALNCRPFIKHRENFRIASLDNPENCGKPIASVRWMEYPDISYRNKTTIELLPGKEAGRYSVCIEGRALKCIKNSVEWDNCENFTLGSTSGNDSPTISDKPLLETTNHRIVAIVFIVSFVLLFVIVNLIIIILLWKHFGLRPKHHAPIQAAPTMRESPMQDVPDGAPGALDTELTPLASSET